MTTKSKAAKVKKAEKLFFEAWERATGTLLPLLALEDPASASVFQAMQSNVAAFSLDQLAYDSTPIVKVMYGLKTELELPSMTADSLKAVFNLENTPDVRSKLVFMYFEEKDIELLFKGDKNKDKLIHILKTFDEDEDAY